MSSSVSLEYLNTFLPTASSGTGITEDGGIYITLINNTGANSVKGTLVRASTSIDNGCSISPANSNATIGIIYENGIANGSPVKVVVSGKAYALLKNSESGTRGYWCGTSDVAGRMIQMIDPPSTSDHNREIGHSLESVTAGTNKLGLINLHFN